METTLEVTEVKNEGLEKALSESSIELSEQAQIRSSYLPYFEQLNLIKEEAKKINFDNPTPLDEKIARDLRIRTMKVRTCSEGVKNDRKRLYMRKADVEQAAWNLIKAGCLHDEEVFNQVEKKMEIAENKRREELKAQRIELLAHYEVDCTFIDLANMPEDGFSNLLASTKMAHEAKIEAARKVEAGRIAKEKADAEEREKQRLENIRLKEESDKKDAELKAQKEAADKALAIVEAKRKAEQDAADRLLKEQRKQAAKAKADAEAKAKKEKEATDALLKAEKEKSDKIAAELKAKKDAELKEEQERIAEVRKAQAAPDKEKLIALRQSIARLALPKMASPEGIKLLSAYKDTLNDLVDTIDKDIQNI